MARTALSRRFVKTRSRNTRSARTTSPSSIRVRIRALGHTRPDVPHAGRDRVGEVDVLGARVQHAGLDPRHVEEVRDQGVQPLGLRVNGLEHLALLLAGPRDLVVEQVGDVRLDRRERTPEIVRDGGEQGLPETLRLPVDLRARRGPKQSIALEHEGELVAKRAEDPALGGCRRLPLTAKHEEPDVVRADAEREALGRSLRSIAGPTRGGCRPGAPRRRHLAGPPTASYRARTTPRPRTRRSHGPARTISRYASGRGGAVTSSREMLEGSAARFARLGGLRPLRRTTEQDRDRHRQPEEHEQHDDVLRRPITNVPYGGRKRKLKTMKPEDRGDDARPDPADRRRHHHDEEPETLRERLDLVTDTGGTRPRARWYRGARPRSRPLAGGLAGGASAGGRYPVRPDRSVPGSFVARGRRPRRKHPTSERRGSGARTWFHHGSHTRRSPASLRVLDGPGPTLGARRMTERGGGMLES